jgi:hypothetical protein
MAGSPKPPTNDFRTVMVRILLGLVPVVAGLYVLAVGQDTNWDLRNYHFYNPFAWLTGRMGHDVAVSHVATYYNPLMYLPFYFTVKALPPKAIGFILGFLPGLNALLLYAIARRAVDLGRPARTAWLCLATALVGFLGAGNIVEIGTSFGDNVLSLAVLAAVWLILRHRHRLAAPGGFAFGVAAAAGLLAGAALGLKQPFAVYAVGLCAAFFGLDLPFSRRFFLAFVFGLGVLAGAAATGGFWMLELWQRFENPLFPYFNQVFQSPWGAAGSYRDERFLPRGPAMWLLFPFYFTANPLQVGEVDFRDLRFPLLYLLLAALLVKALLGLRRTPGVKGAPAAPAASDSRALTRFVLIFLAVSFLLWMKLFAVYRYIVVCEFLAPLALFLVAGALLRDPRRQLVATLACFALLMVTLSPGNWGRRAWTADYFDVPASALSVPPDTAVLVTGHDPMAYMIPFFPPTVRFLRIQGFVTGPSETPNATDRLMQEAVASHTGPLMVLYRDYEKWHAESALQAYGLDRDRTACRSFVPGVEPQQDHLFYFCPVAKKQKPLMGSKD